jgi:hypothetical protein
MFQPGFDVQVLDVPITDLVARLSAAGAEPVEELFMRRYVYERHGKDYPRDTMLIDDGQAITLSVRQINEVAADGKSLHETTVSNFENTHKMLTMLGMQVKSYRENLRSTWKLADWRFHIDTWPMIPPYLVIVGDGYDDVVKAAKVLGFPRKVLSMDTPAIIYVGYGIDLNDIRDLRFTTKMEAPEW